jgi:ribokinase
MVVVFGSINLDLVAGVQRLPRPGETLTARAFGSSPGGKGANQALAARRAGAQVALYGAVGNDNFADAALALLRHDHVDVTGVRIAAAPTGVALIHLDEVGENSITLVPGANALITDDWVPQTALRSGNTVVMQLEVPLASVAALARRARDGGARVVLNAAPAMALTPVLAADVDVLVVNQHEAAMLAAASHLAEPPAQFAAAWATRFGGAAVVTLGADGLVAATDNQIITLHAPAVDVVDTVGAGDALVGRARSRRSAGARAQGRHCSRVARMHASRCAGGAAVARVDHNACGYAHNRIRVTSTYERYAKRVEWVVPALTWKTNNARVDLLRFAQMRGHRGPGGVDSARRSHGARGQLHRHLAQSQ